MKGMSVIGRFRRGPFHFVLFPALAFLGPHAPEGQQGWFSCCTPREMYHILSKCAITRDNVVPENSSKTCVRFASIASKRGK